MPLDMSTPEDAYFAARDARARAKLRAEMEAKAEEVSHRAELSKVTGITDEQAVEHFRALGFTGESASILHLLPLVEVAWADGSVSDAERSAILGAASAHGVAPDSEAGQMLASLLEEKPSQTLLDQILLSLHQLLEAKGHHPDSLVEACQQVAGASGGFFGLGNKIDGEEAAVIEKIVGAFSQEAKDKVQAAYDAQT